MKKYFWAIISIIIGFSEISLYAQNENLSADNGVYSFLKKMQVKGIIPDYDDIVLPLTYNEISKFICKIDSANAYLSEVDKEILIKLKLKYVNYTENQEPVFSDIPNQLFTNAPKNLYFFSDSTVKFIINPFLSLSFIYGQKYKRAAEMVVGGGEVRVSYDDWLGLGVQATNGLAKGSRSVAKYDRMVLQNFNFNGNYLSTFDETSGYINLHKGIFNFEIGRERILWGSGYIDRAILSENPHIFDFVKLNVKYKRLSYNFLHGWLVSLPQYKNDTINNVNKIKIPKYVAISRLGYSNEDNLNLGVSQMVIYSQRPFELAYLNPFIFWESAQRSMNDNDNSFLAFDCRYLLTHGIEMNASIIFDDINLGAKWNAVDNRMMWQSGVIITDPIMLKNMVLKLEYMQLRPYVFSHYGIADALSYTSNGYLLGANIQPNSTRISIAMDYYLTADIKINAKYSYQLHGNNLYDPNSNKIIKNNGGDVSEFPVIGDNPIAYLLAGERETQNLFNIGVGWEFYPGYYLESVYELHKSTTNRIVTSENYFYTRIRFAFD